MKKSFKPDHYNSVAPYFVAPGAQRLVDLLQKIFDAGILRRYDNEDGSIMHVELKIDDSVVMIGDSNDKYPPNQLMTHVYVNDVHATFKKAIDAGCIPIEEPVNKPGDSDIRGMFKDFAGNFWAVGTQNE
jgi:PhnB protein